MAIKDVFHVNVNCTDLERSRAFYELVGFKVVVELGVGGSTDAEYERLKGAGVQFLSPPVGMGGDVRFCCFPDPDGTILELIDFGGAR